MSLQQIQDHFSSHITTIQRVSSDLVAQIEQCSLLMIDALQRGGKVLIMGNGGSAADAQHLAAELVGRFLMERRPLPAIALTTDTSILTAIGNDYGFNEVFSRQVEALAQPGDILIGISTSGNSMNVKLAIEAGRRTGALTVGLLGCDGGEIVRLVDLAITISSNETPRIQEAQLLVIHILCDLVEKGLFSKSAEEL